MRKIGVVVLLAVVSILAGVFWSSEDRKAPPRPSDGGARGGIEEHVYGGLPGSGPVLIRNGYVLSYNPNRRVPVWVAYHIRPDYLNLPEREGAYAKFRPDLEVNNPVQPGEYRGSGYHRGHLAPFFAMGGDRDRDGLYAADGDMDDAQTLFEANYMSNIVPQHARFNGAGGVWYGLETWVRRDLVKKQGKEVWVFAGCVFGPGEQEKIGPGRDISVPPMFFKVVVIEEDGVPVVLAFLFPHQKVKHIISRERVFPYFLVSVDVIEAMTGLDFFSGLKDEEEMERRDTWMNWEAFSEKASKD